MRISLRILAAVIGLGVLSWSSSCSKKPTRLSVALFPYIPDAAGDRYASLMRRLESGFERSNSDIDLVLRPLNQNDNFYDFDTVRTWLSGGGTHGYDVVEVDAIILRDLKDQDLVHAWHIDRKTEADWHPAARSAVAIDGIVFGFPHLLCSHFVFAHDSTVIRARSVDEMVERVRGHGQDARFGGDLRGSWNLPALYIDSWLDSHPSRNPADAIAEPVDSSVLDDLRQLGLLCRDRTGNPCLEGVYEDTARAADDFTSGELTALLGYSEELYYIRERDDRDPTFLAMAPLGRANTPIVFVDALTVRFDASDEVLDAAARFAKYLDSPAVQEIILMSEDGPNRAVPRYIIPATMSAYTARVMRDPFYREIKRDVTTAIPFPNGGLREKREAMERAIGSALKGQ